MKKFVILGLIVVFMASCGADYYNAERVRKEANRQSTEAQIKAQSLIAVPEISYFQERRTIAKWAQHWDRPAAACYVYLISYGQIIGYYVSNGKPASTGSYLTPEYRREPGTQDAQMQLPDIDGTYGTNNPGIRFFTASGIAVEWAGSGASYIYSDVPLKLNVSLLGD
jgi:hypothetical protein